MNDVEELIEELGVIVLEDKGSLGGLRHIGADEAWGS